MCPFAQAGPFVPQWRPQIGEASVRGQQVPESVWPQIRTYRPHVIEGEPLCVTVTVR